MAGMPVEVPHPRPAWAMAAFALALLAFGLLAADLSLHGPITSAADPGVGIWLHRQEHPVLTAFMRGVSHLHGTRVILAMVAVAAVILATMKLRGWLLPLLVAVPGGMLLNEGMKHLFQRARPSFDGRIVELASYAFPSGHTAGATVWWGFVLVFWLAWQRLPRATCRRLCGRRPHGATGGVLPDVPGSPPPERRTGFDRRRKRVAGAVLRVGSGTAVGATRVMMS